MCRSKKKSGLCQQFIRIALMSISAGIFFIPQALSAEPVEKNKADVVIRVDDVGMSHAVNMAVKDLIATGVPFSASVMVPCPWLNEAVNLLNNQPHVAVGLHLTLTSEFKEYKWGPVSDKDDVPSLVGEDGFFRPSVREFLLSGYTLDDVETEIRAQIEKAKQAGLQFSYLDHHMGIVRSTPEIAAVLERVAKDYGLAISRYFHEVPDDLFHYAIDDKKPALIQKVKNLSSGQLNMLIMHPGRHTEELSALTDLNSNSMIDSKTGESIMAKHRAAELSALTDPEFIAAIKQHNALTYDDLIEAHTLAGQVQGGIIYASKAASIQAAKKMMIEANK